MTKPTVPELPSLSNKTTFLTLAQVFFVWLTTTFIDWIDATATAMNFNSTNDVSATSLLISTGSKSLMVSPSKSFVGGMYVVLADTAAPSTNSMTAQVTSYNASTGAMVVNVVELRGSGTKTAWTISQSIPLPLTTLSADTGASLIGFKQSGTGAVSRTLDSKARESVSIFDFMSAAQIADVTSGTGALDVSSAFNAAIADANLKGGIDRANVRGTTIFLPDGWYNLPSAIIPVTVSGVYFQGASRGGTVLRLSHTGSTFNFGTGTTGNPDWSGNCGFSDVKIEYPSGATVGACVATLDKCFNFSMSNIFIHRIGTLINMGVTAARPCSGVHLDNIDGSVENIGTAFLRFSYGAGFKMSNSGVFVSGVLTPIHPASMTTVANTTFLSVTSSGNWDTAQFTNVIVERFYRGVSITVTAGGIFQNFYFDNFICDYTRKESVILDAAGGLVIGFQFGSTCWYVSWETAAINLSQTTGLNDYHRFSGNIVIAGDAGVDYSVESAFDNTFMGMKISACGRTGNNTAAMFFRDGSKGYTVKDCQGNQDTTAIGLPWRCNYGIYTGIDSDEYMISGCNFQGIFGGYLHATNTSSSSLRKSSNNNRANYAGALALTMPASNTQLFNTTPNTWELIFTGGTVVAGYDKNNTGFAGASTYLSVRLEPGDFIRCGYTVAPSVTRFVMY